MQEDTDSIGRWVTSRLECVFPAKYSRTCSLLSSIRRLDYLRISLEASLMKFLWLQMVLLALRSEGNLSWSLTKKIEFVGGSVL